MKLEILLLVVLIIGAHATLPVKQKMINVHANITHEYAWVSVNPESASNPPVDEYLLEYEIDTYFPSPPMFPKYQQVTIQPSNLNRVLSLSDLTQLPVTHYVLTIQVKAHNTDGWGSLSDPVVVYPGGTIAVGDAEYNSTSSIAPAFGKMAIIDPNYLTPNPGFIGSKAKGKSFQGFPVYRANSNYIVQYAGHSRFKFNMNQLQIEYVPASTKATSSEAKFDAGVNSMDDCFLWQKSRVYCVYPDRLEVILFDATQGAITQGQPESKSDKIKVVVPATASVKPPNMTPDKSVLIGDAIILFYEEDQYDYVYDIKGNDWLKIELSSVMMSDIIGQDSGAIVDYHHMTAFDNYLAYFVTTSHTGDPTLSVLKEMKTLEIDVDDIRDGITNSNSWSTLSCNIHTSYCPDITMWPNSGSTSYATPTSYRIFNYDGNMITVSYYSDSVFVPPKTAISTINQYDPGTNTWTLLYNSSRPLYWDSDMNNPGAVSITPNTDFKTYMHGSKAFFAQIDGMIFMWTDQLGSVEKFIGFNVAQHPRCNPNQPAPQCKKCQTGQYFYPFIVDDGSGSVYGSQPFAERCEPCLQGVYSDTQNAIMSCTKCSQGYYNDLAEQSACTACPPGTYDNELGGGASKRSMCIPCDAGQKNPLSGQSSCVGCSVASKCPIASATEIDSNLQKFNYTNLQPSPFVRGTKEAAAINIIVYAVIGGLAAAIVLALLFLVKKGGPKSKIRGIVSGLDVYVQIHPTKIVPGPKVDRQTWTGGVFSVIYYMLFLALGVALIVTFMYDNELETTSTLPGIGGAVIKTPFNYTVKFHGWPDLCVKGEPITRSSTGQCINKISVSTTSLNKAVGTITCAYDFTSTAIIIPCTHYTTAKTCTIGYESQATGLSVDSAILVQSRSASALAQAIEWSFSVPSYKTGEFSEVNAILVPDSSSVAIRGQTPWQSSVTLAAAQYKNLVEGTATRGFITEYLAFVKGSQQSSNTMRNAAFTSQTDVGVGFQLAIVTAQYNVVIQFQVILGVLALVTQLLAAVAGAKSMVVGALGVVESKLEGKNVNINGPKGSGYLNDEEVKMEAMKEETRKKEEEEEEKEEKKEKKKEKKEEEKEKESSQV